VREAARTIASRPNTRSVSIHIDYHRGSARRARLFLTKARLKCMLCYGAGHSRTMCMPEPASSVGELTLSGATSSGRSRFAQISRTR
jgi:hypothetical protein